MMKPRHPTTMEKLPSKVLSDIFIRLLAKEVAQMRSVCKSWNALLSDSSFIESYLHRSIHNNDNILLFFRMDNYCTSFTAHPSRSPNLELTNFIKLPVNLQPKYTVIGSVNGLICFYYMSYHHDYVINIWNPSLSVLLTLPQSSLAAHGIGFGFGVDPKTHDYKVVYLSCACKLPNLVPQAEVYSMRKGSWESISQSFPSHINFFDYQHNVCVDGHDGHLHWLCYTDLEQKPKTIVAFDLAADSEIPLPDSILHYDVYKSSNVLGAVGGKLCVMSRAIDGKCEVWVMDEYGVPESWVKHHAFSQFGHIRPYGFTLQNEFLFRDYDRFGLYDPVAAKTKTF